MTIPGLTTTERAAELGLSFNEYLKLQREQPWVASWSARYDQGAARLRAWLAAGRPAVDRAALCVVGDRTIVDATRGVVASLPEAVAHYLVNSVTFACAGIESRGWCGDPLPQPPDPQRHITLTVADHGSIAHECGHAWHKGRSVALGKLSADQRERLCHAARVMAVEGSRAEEFVNDVMRGERAADAIATAWGFPVDTTSGLRGERRREGLRRDIAHSLEVARELEESAA